MNFDQKLEQFGRLLNIMDELREKCPWDKKQTFQSLRNLTIEETYELVDALLEENLNDIKEELGDIFLHLVFYAKIGEEKGAFDVGNVLNDVCEKLIRRHPHIYSDVNADTEQKVKENWEKIKLREGKKSVLQGVPNSLPAMVKAYRMQEKAAQVGFDWEHIEQVKEKLNEELDELKEAISNKNQDAIEDEFGDVMFAMINYARFLKIEPETALARTNTKFKTRFEFIESHAKKSLTEMSLLEMDELWNQAKKLEN